MNRPIIFKVLSTFDKELIYQNIAKLKEFYEVEILQYSLLTIYQRSSAIKKSYYYLRFMLPNKTKIGSLGRF